MAQTGVQKLATGFRHTFRSPSALLLSGWTSAIDPTESDRRSNPRIPGTEFSIHARESKQATLASMKPDHPPDPTRRRSFLTGHLTCGFILASILCLTACRTHSYTEADLERERRHLAEGDVAWYGHWSRQAGFGVSYLDPRYNSTEGFQVFGDHSNACRSAQER